MKSLDVIATVWVRWNAKGNKWDMSRSIPGTKVKTAPDGVSALVSFSNPSNRGFLPIVTSVSGKATKDTLFLSALGGKGNNTFQVSATGTGVGIGFGKIRPTSFTAIVVGL